mmetsp:Transcript_23397/g.79035  ORF Transcript_23397/g.79035 Transcript_23397/m.79035 type:complete len:214 (+) Transcript_23397:860-1501(+)
MRALKTRARGCARGSRPLRCRATSSTSRPSASASSNSLHTASTRSGAGRAWVARASSSATRRTPWPHSSAKGPIRPCRTATASLQRWQSSSARRRRRSKRRSRPTRTNASFSRRSWPSTRESSAQSRPSSRSSRATRSFAPQRRSAWPSSSTWMAPCPACSKSDPFNPWESLSRVLETPSGRALASLAVTRKASARSLASPLEGHYQPATHGP